MRFLHSPKDMKEQRRRSQTLAQKLSERSEYRQDGISTSHRKVRNSPTETVRRDRCSLCCEVIRVAQATALCRDSPRVSFPRHKECSCAGVGGPRRALRRVPLWFCTAMRHCNNSKYYHCFNFSYAPHNDVSVTDGRGPIRLKYYIIIS